MNETTTTTAITTPYDRWITLDAAAKYLGYSKRMIERFCKARLLVTIYGRPADARQKTRLVDPDQVASLKDQITTGEVSLKYNKSKQLVRQKPVPVTANAVDLRRVAKTMQKSSQLTRYTQTSDDPWLTVEEAATYSRLPAAYLRRCIDGNELDARNVLDRTDRFSWRIKRSAVDGLPPTSPDGETRRYRALGITGIDGD